MDMETSPRRILVVLLSIISLLVLANIVGIVSTFAFGQDSAFGLFHLFDLNNERNIPTLFSSLQLVVAALLLFLFGSKHRTSGNSYIAWLLLAMIFLFLAVDETASIHERLSDPMRALTGPSGLLYFPWVIPYGIGVLVLLIGFSGFLMRLPTSVKQWFFASGAIYIAGAIGFEMLSARHKELYGPDNVAYALYYTCEETLEMIGIAIFIYALLRYACATFDGISIAMRGDDNRGAH
jgi:hypothetical protein